MLDIQQYGDFKPLGKQKKKKQIILCHTSREVEEYLASLKFRYYTKYDKIPNYVVTRKGEVLQLLGDSSYSNVFEDSNIKEYYDRLKSRMQLMLDKIIRGTDH